jgi:hypothetical protein
MLSVTYAGCLAYTLYAKCLYAECRYAECCHAECGYKTLGILVESQTKILDEKRELSSDFFRN